jgi:CMP/dCMP kinase
MPDPSQTIAISRQLGSGGTLIGREVAARLGMRYIDRELLRHAAEFLQAEDERAEDGASGAWWSRLGAAMSMASAGFGHATPALQTIYEGELLGIEERLLGELAGNDRAVIVGCGAAQTLKGRPRVLSVFLHAPAAGRAARVQQVHRLSDARAAERAVRESDRNRARFIRQLTGVAWTDAGGYDLAVDTSTMSLEASITLIVQAAAARRLSGDGSQLQPLGDHQLAVVADSLNQNDV